MQFVFENLVFAFQFNEMRLNCHTKPPRLDETSDSIRTMEFTRACESVDGYRKLNSHFWVSYVTNREDGTRLADRARRGDILVSRLRNLLQSHRAFQLTYIMTDQDERELETSSHGCSRNTAI